MERLNNETLKNAISVYETTVKEIEEYGIDDPDYCPALDKSTLSFLKELKEYRDAEEQGLLVRFPCKVGDIVFEASRAWKMVLERNVASIAIYKNSIWIRNGCGDSFEYGIEVFLTKEEAEAALERMGEDVKYSD